MLHLKHKLKLIYHLSKFKHNYVSFIYEIVCYENVIYKEKGIIKSVDQHL